MKEVQNGEKSMDEKLLNELLRKIKEEIEKGKNENEHPLTHLHYVARNVLKLTEEALEITEALIKDQKAKLKEMRKELRRLYGYGYITVKSVKNKVGKTYHYVVYRVLRPKRKDIYLNKDLARIRNKLKHLNLLRKELKRLKQKAWIVMKATEDYA